MVSSFTSAPETRRVSDTAPEPPPPRGASARAMLFQGWDDAEIHLLALRRYATPFGSRPRLVMLPGLERAALRCHGPSDRVRGAAAFGFCAHFALPPRRAADLYLETEAQRRALAADHVSLEVVEYDAGGFSLRRFRVEMLRRGKGPFRFNFRFTMRTERWDLPDGTVLMRHDRYPYPPAEHVTYYRGAALFEPDGTGSRITEFLVLGTDIAVPFFLAGVLRKGSVDVFRNRASALWEQMQTRAAGR